MEKRAEVHVLPCLIKEATEVDVKERFTKKIFPADTSTSQPEGSLGSFNLNDICGKAADEAGFTVDTTEHFARDVYSSDQGQDPLFSGEPLCNILRGRCIRGRQLNLQALGHRLSVVDVTTTTARDSRILRNTNIPCKRVTEKDKICSLTVWNQDQDIGPLDPNLAAYKHMLVASALYDYSEEKQFIENMQGNV